MEFSNPDTCICDKHDIYLHKNDPSHFSLSFNIANPRIIIPNLITMDVYPLLAKLNTDVLERIQITNIFSENKISILFIFKRFGAELGMAQKYMHTVIERRVTNKNITFISKSIPLTKDVPENCEWVLCNDSQIIVNVENQHDIKVDYEFHMELNEDLPIYMENIPGLLMKKLFIRLKQFIEQIQ